MRALLVLIWTDSCQPEIESILLLIVSRLRHCYASMCRFQLYLAEATRASLGLCATLLLSAFKLPVSVVGQSSPRITLFDFMKGSSFVKYAFLFEVVSVQRHSIGSCTSTFVFCQTNEAVTWPDPWTVTPKASRECHIVINKFEACI